MRALAALVLGFIAAGHAPEPVRAGLLVTTSGHSVVAIAGPALTDGAALTVVTTEEPQQVWRAVVVKRVAASDAMDRHTVNGPYYEVTSDSGSSALPDLAIAVLGRAAVEQTGKTVRLRLGSPLVMIRARSCTSSEGLHLTLWNGQPLKATRLWHAYYYLGYDVTPTCQAADYREGA